MKRRGSLATLSALAVLESLKDTEDAVIEYVRTHPLMIERMFREHVFSPMELLLNWYARRIGTGNSLSYLSYSNHMQESTEVLLHYVHDTYLSCTNNGYEIYKTRPIPGEKHQVDVYAKAVVCWWHDRIVFISNGQRVDYGFPDGWMIPEEEYRAYPERKRPTVDTLQDYIDRILPYMERAWPIISTYYEKLE